MDFQKRDEPASHSAHVSAGAGHRQSRRKGMAWLRFSSALLLFSGTILIIALLVYLAIGGQKSESSYVDNTDLQAVFLNGGQVYFGNITNLNDKYVRLTNIYYLRVNQQVQPKNQSQQANNISLVKLGCELHGPQDSMLINRDQVMFWENLKSDGQVAKAVVKFVKENPTGQKCA